MAKILVITDFDLNFSGYKNIAAHTLSGLAAKGHEIKVLGLSYRGQEHSYPFSVLPSSNINDTKYQATNLASLWPPDILLVMLDIPLQNFFFQNLPMFQDKYIAVTPLENGPIMMSWAAMIINMKAILFISELGRDEARRVGIGRADYIQIGIDSAKWRLSTPEEKSQIRKGLGFDDDTFIILTVADNQERKNLWAGMEAVHRLKERHPDKKFRYVVVTREDSEVGWKLKDLANDMKMNQEFVIFRRGMPQQELWGLYAISDAFLLPSKAEGLGMPILEAFSCGVPVVGTDTGAIHELLDDNRGFLIPPEYTFIDVWGNSKRDMMDIDIASHALEHIMYSGAKDVVAKARTYVEERTWEKSTEKLHETIEKVLNEKK